MTSIGWRDTHMNRACGYTRVSNSAYRAVPRLLSQYRFFPRRARYDPTIRSIVSRTPTIAASGTSGGSSPRFADNGAPSISDHTVANCTHNTGRFVSGGHASSGCASNRNRSSVDPDRPLHSTKTGSAKVKREAGASTSDVTEERRMLQRSAVRNHRVRPEVCGAADVHVPVRQMPGDGIGPASAEPPLCDVIPVRIRLIPGIPGVI